MYRSMHSPNQSLPLLNRGNVVVAVEDALGEDIFRYHAGKALRRAVSIVVIVMTGKMLWLPFQGTVLGCIQVTSRRSQALVVSLRPWIQPGNCDVLTAGLGRVGARRAWTNEYQASPLPCPSRHVGVLLSTSCAW